MPLSSPRRKPPGTGGERDKWLQEAPSPAATHLLLPPGHVSGLLGVERVRDAPHHEDVELQADAPLLLLIQLPFGLISPLAEYRGARAHGSSRSATATTTGASRCVPPPFPSRGRRRSLGAARRHQYLAALLLQPLVRLLLAGRRVEHGAGWDAWARPAIPGGSSASAAVPAGPREPRTIRGGRRTKGKVARAFRTRRVRAPECLPRPGRGAGERSGGRREAELARGRSGRPGTARPASGGQPACARAQPRRRPPPPAQVRNLWRLPSNTWNGMSRSGRGDAECACAPRRARHRQDRAAGVPGTPERAVCRGRDVLSADDPGPPSTQVSRRLPVGVTVG